MSDTLNDLTRQLYAQGYTRENHPDTVYWSDWQNFGYKWETALGFTWETPCGLLIQGNSSMGRNVASSECFYQHVWYCPENDNPLLRCPYLRKGCEHIPPGLKLIMCPCHQTDKPYDYEHSAEKVEAERNQEAHKQYMELTGGVYCACVVGNNGYEGGWYEVKYDVEQCIQQGCISPICTGTMMSVTTILSFTMKWRTSASPGVNNGTCCRTCGMLPRALRLSTRSTRSKPGPQKSGPQENIAES